MARSGAQNEREAIAMNDGVNNPADRCRLSISGEVSPCRCIQAHNAMPANFAGIQVSSRGSR